MAENKPHGGGQCPRRVAMQVCAGAAQVAAFRANELAGHLIAAIAMPVLLEQTPDHMVLALDATIEFDKSLKGLAQALGALPANDMAAIAGQGAAAPTAADAIGMAAEIACETGDFRPEATIRNLRALGYDVVRIGANALN